MKKLSVLALAALLVVAFTIPAWAMEAEFGGYWRTRFFTNQNFTGEDETEAQDVSQVDTRTRLYFTAIFHENLKFVNKFEFDADWGTGPLGDIGADGKEFEIKNSYADFNLGPVNFKVGIQGVALGSSFLIDNDLSGAAVTFQGEMFTIPVMWFKAFEGSELGTIDDNEFDVDIFAVDPHFMAGPVTINPFGMYIYSEDASAWGVLPGDAEEANIWYAGLSVDYDVAPLWVWATGIYQGGELDDVFGNTTDFEAYLGAAGFDVDFGGMFSLHGEGFYASGDDDPADGDFEAFYVPATLESYYWSEIMGYGIFDDQVSNNSPADQISNIIAGNLGFTIKPIDDLKITLDAWYAQLAEEIIINGSEEDYLGTEIDLIITYQLVQGLNLDLVGAYLFAGEATTLDDPDEADPYEVGARLSLSF